MDRDINVVVGGPVNADYPKVYKNNALKPNIPFAVQVTEPDTKYTIRHNYDLGGENITVPENCILEFDGGSVDNGILVGQNTLFINVGDVEIWGKNLTREGTWREKYYSKADIYGELNSINDRINSLNGSKANKSTTLGGYGINNAYTKSEADSRINTEKQRAIAAEAALDETKANRTNTLAGYGIEDAYTKSQIDTMFSRGSETPVVILDVPEGSTAAAVLNEIPVADRPNKIFRLRNDSNTGFSDYGWDGTNFVPLGEHEPGIDETPTKGSQNYVTSNGLKEGFSNIQKDKYNTFYCINSIEKTCNCDKNYSVDEDDYHNSSIPMSRQEDVMNHYFKVLNTDGKNITLAKDYSVDGDNVSKESNEVMQNDNFHKGISGIYTITESDSDFVGFPTVVNHNNVLYMFYRRSKFHDLTPNQSTLNIYYKFSVDSGENWSEEYSIQFPDTPNNTSEDAPEAWNGIHIDWRAYYYVSYGGYIYGCTWGCVFYGDGSYDGDRKNYPSVLVRISQNKSKTLKLEKIQWFPEIELWNRENAVSFDRERMNYYNRPTPNWDDYHGCLVGGPVTIKNGVMYIPMYYASVGVVSWVINKDLNVNPSNFKLIGSLNRSDYNNTLIDATESTVWIDDNGKIKTLVRFDRKSTGNGGYKQSRIYRIDVENKSYVELARCCMCEGPSNTMIESNKTIIIGRGPIAYSNIILYDNTKDEVVSELNQFDTPGYYTGWTDSFYGSVTRRNGMYFIAFYKRISSSKTTINYFTIDRLNLNINTNYNKKEINMGNIVKKNDILINSNYQYLIPCSALIKKAPVYYYYVPSFVNSKRVDLLGTIVFMTSFGTYRNQVGDGEQMTISLKDSANDVCLLYMYKKRINESDNTKVDVDIQIRYKHGNYYKEYYRVLVQENGGYPLMLNPTIVVNTSTDKTSCLFSRLFTESGGTPDYRGYSRYEKEGSEAEFDDSIYPDGIKIESTFHARIGTVGALVNGKPILSIVPNDDYTIDMVSGKYLYTYTGNMQSGSAQNFNYTPSCISDFNDWILKSIDEVQQI